MTTTKDRNDITATEHQLGPRGTAHVSSDNRNLVRRWLCAQGVPSKTARTLTLGELRSAYNDLTNSALSALTTDGPQPEPQQPEPETMTQPQTAPQPQADDRAAAITAAITQALGNFDKPAVDEKQIIDLIKKHAPATRIEIQQAGETRKVEGLHHYATGPVVKMLSAGVNVWLAGPAGSGKTTIAEVASKSLARPFYSTGAVQSEYKLTGFVDAKGEAVRTPFREAFEHGGVFLWDEIDGSNPAALVAFNQALANGHFAFPDGMVEKHPEFIAIAAGNTWGTGATAEYVGRTRIDAATLDRFAQVFVDYDEALEKTLAGEYSDWANEVQTYRKRAKSAGVRCIISTRAIINGAKMKAAGIEKEQILATLIRRGLDDATWSKIKAA